MLSIKVVAALLPLFVFGLLIIKRDMKNQAVEARLGRLVSGTTGDHVHRNWWSWANLKNAENKGALLVIALTWVAIMILRLPLWLGSILVPVLAVVAWWAIRRQRVKKIRILFARRFPDAVATLTRAVQAGVPVERALGSIGEIYEGEIAERFTQLVRHLELGVGFRDALKLFSHDLNLPDVDFFCAILALNREHGSRLSPMLVSLGQTLRDRKSAERRLQALTAETRGSARILSVLPIFVIGLQAFLNPKQLQFLIADPLGRTVLGYCLVSMWIGLLVIRRMSRLLGD
ncbi:MAG: type II secretion system F family protein [Deltaproteobacteria bacterium]|nr:type II secretion system F family protein [Deltaproteobacteria bacterium]